MRLECHQCATKYAIGDEKVQGPGRVFKIRCKKCGAILTFHGVADGTKAAAPVNEAASPASWYYVKDGEQVGPVSIAGLRSARESGDLGADSYVWRTGMDDWLPLVEVDELSAIHVLEDGPVEPYRPQDGADHADVSDDLLDAIAAEAELARSYEPAPGTADQTLMETPPTAVQSHDSDSYLDEAFAPAPDPPAAAPVEPEVPRVSQPQKPVGTFDDFMMDRTIEAPSPWLLAAGSDSSAMADEPGEAEPDADPWAMGGPSEPAPAAWAAEPRPGAPASPDVHPGPSIEPEPRPSRAAEAAPQKPPAPEARPSQPAPDLNATLDDLFVGDLVDAKKAAGGRGASFFGDGLGEERPDSPRADELATIGAKKAGGENQELVWQRHDNSVLFSMSDLEDTRGAHPERRNEKSKALAALTADSGLIDIRSFKKKKETSSAAGLFSDLEGEEEVAPPPAQAPAPALIPVLQRKKSRLPMVLGVAALLVAAIGGTIAIMKFVVGPNDGKAGEQQPARTPTRVAEAEKGSTEQPGQTQPGQTQPGQTQPGQTQPGQAQPVAVAAQDPGKAVAESPAGAQPMAGPAGAAVEPARPVEPAAPAVPGTEVAAVAEAPKAEGAPGAPPEAGAAAGEPQPGRPDGVEAKPGEPAAPAEEEKPKEPERPLTPEEKAKLKKKMEEAKKAREERKKELAEEKARKEEERAAEEARRKAAEAAKVRPVVDPNALLKKTIGQAEKPDEPAADSGEGTGLPTRLTTTQVSRVVKSVAGTVRNCVTASGQSNVQVTTSFVIQPSGGVSGASVRGPVAGTSAAGCVQAAISGLRFPAFDGPPKRVTYPFFIK